MHTLTPSPIPAGLPEGLDTEVRVAHDVTVVELRGPLDVYTVPSFRERVESLSGPGSRLVVDLGGVTILDSCGIGALLRLRARAAREQGSRFGLVCPRRRLRRVIDIAGLQPAFELERDLDHLIASWRHARAAHDGTVRRELEAEMEEAAEPARA